MSIEPPYPGAAARPDEPVVTYTMRDIIDQINTKLDVLTTTFGTRMSDMELRVSHLEHSPTPIRDGELRMQNVESLAEKLDARADTFEKLQEQQLATDVFKDKAWTKLVGLATIMGVVAGATVGLLQLFT